VTAERQERWIVVRSHEGETRARATMQRQVERDQDIWTTRLWHLSHREFACEADAQQALAHELRHCPPWIQVQTTLIAVRKHQRRGRPRKAATTDTRWQIQSTLTIDATAVDAEALRRAAFLISTNLLDMARWPDQAIIALYREQSVVEKGFAFLKDPLFLASSVFVKKPERIMAIAFIMTLCLLVYKLAEWRVRQQLVATQQSVPNQLKRPTQRPTMRWLFQCFEGIDLLHIPLPDGSCHSVVLRLTGLHRLVLHLLGPAYENCYFCLSQSAE
jgi:transposase